MPKQQDPPSPTKPVPASWWFLTGGVGAPPRTQAGFHRLASERKAAYRARVMAKQEREEAEHARKDALAKVEQARKDALAKLEAEHGPSGFVSKMLWRLRGGAGDNCQKEEEGKGDEGTVDDEDGNRTYQQRRQRLSRKDLMERYGPDSGVKTGRAAMAMTKSRGVPKPKADAHAGGSGDQASVDDTAANNATADDPGADNGEAHDTGADNTGADGATADDTGADDARDAGVKNAGADDEGADDGGAGNAQADDAGATADNTAPVDGISNENTAG
ncbi:hypothetical protein PG996_000812 [Apiospora saccharicola]|uniref:Uncharacterized protein n=1 Tax=Apiospora saccharicola TaxID=335842 RepID=A0ABR1WEV1_9PEZI